MKFLNKIILVVLLVSVLFITLFFNHNNNDEIGLQGTLLNRFNIKITSENDEMITFSGKNNDEIIKINKISNMTETEQESYMQDTFLVIKSLYREINSPYPGKFSNKIKCPEEFIPIEKKELNHTYLVLYANDRLNYGACSWDLIEYKTIFSFIECDSTLFQVELFIPKKKNSSVFSFVLCQ